MQLLSWIGPLALVGSAVYVYQANCESNNNNNTNFLVSTKVYCVSLFLVYCTGAIPRNPLFPAVFFRSNIFSMLYKLYCTERFGYHVLSKVLHQHTPYPHSDYRYGVRCLSDCDLPLMRVSTSMHNTPTTAAARTIRTHSFDTAAADGHAPATTSPQMVGFYSLGGGVIDLTRVGTRAPPCRGCWLYPCPSLPTTTPTLLSAYPPTP